MSVDLFYSYVFKGNSKDLADLVRNHFTSNYGFPDSLVDYPESLSYTKQYSAEQIIDEEITEMTVRVLVVKRHQFTNQFIEEDILAEMQNQYPDLEITMVYSGQ